MSSLCRRNRNGFIACLILSALALASAPAVAAEDYAADPVHSSANFKIKHVNVSYVVGRFDKLEASFCLDPAALAFEVKITADSVNTGNKDRDKHVKGPDFFNAAQFPDITFKSTAAKAVDGGYEVTGDLTLHGVTKAVTLKIEKVGEGDGPTGKDHRAGLATEFVIKRSDFGMDKMLKGVGDDVKLLVCIEGVRK